MENNNHPKFFLGALLGSAIGVMTTLLLTPESGVEMRKKISRGVNTNLLKPLSHHKSPRRSARIQRSRIQRTRKPLAKKRVVSAKVVSSKK